jgi:tyrosine-protein phosphatase SIW14
MRIKRIPSIILLKAIFVLLIFVSSGLTAESDRPARWATPIQMPGVDNFFKVTDYLYRSEQPTEEGMKHLKKMGIKTVINLRVFHSDLKKTQKTGLLNEELSVKPWHIEDEDVIRVLRIIRKRKNGPFLMHCWRGADRLGLMVAMFRIVEQRWTKDEAIEEMVNGGYGFHETWQNIIEYIKNVDLDKIRKGVEREVIFCDETSASQQGRNRIWKNEYDEFVHKEGFYEYEKDTVPGRCSGVHGSSDTMCLGSSKVACI